MEYFRAAFFLQQDQCDAKISNNTKLINRIIECRDLDECDCSKLGDNYFFILEKCYYVEINLSNYTDAMVNCQNQFGSSHTGKLFEPRDLATNDAVIDYAQGIRNHQFWLGINDIDIEGTFQYATGGNLVFTNWDAGQPDNAGGAQNCAIIFNPSINQRNDCQCWGQSASTVKSRAVACLN